MKRQALSITLGELYNLAGSLLDEELSYRLDLEHKLRNSIKKIPDQELFKITEEVLKQKMQIVIINKTPEYSDTWEIEKIKHR
ncbi:MAG: hypothetical protein Q8N63_03130 [Nanoarchaeota archaeon]|nr:hypothetical protein [Nanoarchaeota archaeon]